MNELKNILLGLDDHHTVQIENHQRVHQEVLTPLRELQQRAEKAGFEFLVCSGFRSFQRQCEIWNRKVKESSFSSESETIHSILRWSALPGLSRHHWGTDFDVIDKKGLAPHYQVKLTPDEFELGGPFHELHEWLDTEMEMLGFFRPYKSDRGGVSPERWHLSYAPLAQKYLAVLKMEDVQEEIEKSSLLLKKKVLSELPLIMNRYTLNIDIP